VNTEKRDNRQDIVLSKICCQRLKEIQDVSYANAYTLFHLRHYKAVQQSLRNISPKIKEAGDWVRLRFEGVAVALSISDDAIKAYSPLIYEFQCFASAVRLLGIYEDHIKNIVDIAEDRIPDEMTQFRNSHQIRIREKKRFWSEQSGRGVDFLQRVFGWNPLPSYRPGLQLM